MDLSYGNSTTSVGLSANSKRIKKSQPQRKAEYQTFTKAQKQDIILHIREALDPKFYEKDYFPEGLISELDGLDVPFFNKILVKAFKPHMEDPNKILIQDTKWLKESRKKVKEWVKNIEKPETRGGVLVPFEKLSEFKEKLTPKILCLQTRSFDQIQKALVSVFREMSISADKVSKHFWYDFLSKNEDINSLWESLPGRNTIKTSQKKRVKEDYSTASSSQNTDSPSGYVSSPEQISYFDQISLSSPFNSENIYLNFEASQSFSQREFSELDSNFAPRTTEVVTQQTIPEYNFYQRYETIIESEDDQRQREFFALFNKNWNSSQRETIWLPLEN